MFNARRCSQSAPNPCSQGSSTLSRLRPACTLGGTRLRWASRRLVLRIVIIGGVSGLVTVRPCCHLYHWRAACSDSMTTREILSTNSSLTFCTKARRSWATRSSTPGTWRRRRTWAPPFGSCCVPRSRSGRRGNHHVAGHPEASRLSEVAEVLPEVPVLFAAVDDRGHVVHAQRLDAAAVRYGPASP